MFNLSVFDFQSQEVRVLTIDGKPWFVAKDLCSVLAVANNRDAIKRLDEDEKRVALTDTSTGEKEVTVVSESGMYALVLSSRKPQAKPFRKWVTSEVLPAIRQTGKYEATPQPQSTGDMLVIFAQAFKEHEQRLSLIEQENAKLTQQLQGMTATLEVHDIELHGVNAELDRFSNGHGYWYSIIGYAAKKGIKLSLQQAQELGRKASAMCRASNIKPQKLSDSRYGNVQSYPDWVLEETF